jgi:hypothetical protein
MGMFIALRHRKTNAKRKSYGYPSGSGLDQHPVPLDGLKKERAA